MNAPTPLNVVRVESDPDSELAFERLFGQYEDAFWLDSSRVGESARFSFLGAPGPQGAVITYDLAARTVSERQADGETTVREESIFDYLERELARLRLVRTELPFEFECGFVGWFGYELKAETGGEAAHRSALADAAFIRADRLVACDHEDGRTYVLSLTDDGWAEQTASILESLPAGRGEPQPIPTKGEPLAFSLARSHERYLEDVAACRRALHEGESYEICLTNQIIADLGPEIEPLPLYRALRRVNPAPFAALLRIDGTAVLSSSPERFLRLNTGGEIEAKPIKGTGARGETPAADAAAAAALRGDAKNRAENLMIVDLLRNDLGRVCEIGSVEVPRLMEVESYETVHQLVSTIRGRLRPGLGAVDAVRSCFPPGSMTGAPKERTMAIIDRLEGASRGVYAGSIGWLGLSGGGDLSVAIRSIVLHEGQASIGVGGAIVIGSEPEQEYEEMLLKGWAPMRALDPTLPPAYRRSRFGAESSPVTPRKSITNAAAETSAG